MSTTNSRLWGRLLEGVVFSLCLCMLAPVRAEILVGPGGATQAAPTSRDAATEQRERARAQRTDGHASPGQTIIIIDEDDGPYSSRRGGAATDTRNRARMYQKGNDGPAPGELERALGLEGDTPRSRASSNLDKARAYQRGDSPATSVAPQLGSGEKLPLVDCNQTDNVTARIGDDVASGSIITIFRDGKGIRVRCR